MGEATIPSQPPSMSLSGSNSIPPGMGSGPTGPSWHTSTPNTSYASINVPGPAPSKAPWIVAGGAMAVAAALAIGLVVSKRGVPSPSLGTTAATTAVAKTAEPTPPPPDTTTAKDDTPTMSVDSLPQASGKAVSGPVVKGYGRVFVSAAPGWCTVSVDGKERGPTPIAGMDISAGMHTLTCKTPTGKTKSMVVNVLDGQTAKQKFSLDD
jgi:hypothetical protein